MEEEPANAAIDGLDGFELDGRIISVNEARPRAPKEEPSSASDEIEADE
jgi:RNA recognition motif-containing protein